MQPLKHRLIAFYSSLGSRYLPFADLTTPDLTFARLLRLSLFQISVGMTLVLLVGTLNRVMIVELGVPAMVVGLMIGLPLLFAPLRALIGHKSDTHRCELGWRRVPYIWRGTLLQFGGYAIMPFAILVLAGRGEAGNAPQWIGYASAAAAFLLVGAGAHIVQTAGLALATDLTPPQSHPRVVGLMYAMLLVGMIGSALIFGLALDNFYAPRLIQVIQGAAIVCVVLNAVAAWKQEARSADRRPRKDVQDPTFREAWFHFSKDVGTTHRLVIVGLGTMAFAMSEVLLEPYGGQVLQWSVASTTKLTALLAFGSLIGLVIGSYTLASQADPNRISLFALAIGIPAFVLICVAAPYQAHLAFLFGNLLIGIGAALFAHATLTATMSQASAGQAGLALGAWGAVQATAAGCAMALGSVLRDIVEIFVAADRQSATGYLTVYALEIFLLIATIALLIPLLSRVRRKQHEELTSSHAGSSAYAALPSSQKGLDHGRS